MSGAQGTGLVIRDLEAGYGSLGVLHGPSLSVAAGTTVLLTGPNGAGKTTLLGALLGLVDVTSGTIELDGEDLTSMGRSDRLRRRIGWVPEGRALFSGLTVRENLRVAARAWGVPRREVADRIGGVADRFPMVAGKLDSPVATLSGGQQQSVAVARAFLGEPRCLLLDEPSTGLSPLAWKGVLDTCSQAAAAGASVLLVEQRLLGSLDAVDRVAVMVQGRVVRDVATGDADASEEQLRRAYFPARSAS